MDPNACLEQILQDLIDLQNGTLTPEEVKDTREDFCDGLENLRRWVKNGGFIPTIKVRVQ